ncbi:MAG: hypothetical protein AAGA48_29000 [Myxococcota bacterium]
MGGGLLAAVATVFLLTAGASRRAQSAVTAGVAAAVKVMGAAETCLRDSDALVARAPDYMNSG